MIKQTAHRNGELASFVASFIFDGVLHTVFEQNEWLEEFESHADERRLREKQHTKADIKKTWAHAKTLCKHPKFNDGRPSREKRVYLARSIFSDLSEPEIYAVVDEAINMDWLTSN